MARGRSCAVRERAKQELTDRRWQNVSNRFDASRPAAPRPGAQHRTLGDGAGRTRTDLDRLVRGELCMRVDPLGPSVEVLSGVGDGQPARSRRNRSSAAIRPATADVALTAFLHDDGWLPGRRRRGVPESLCGQPLWQAVRTTGRSRALRHGRCLGVPSGLAREHSAAAPTRCCLSFKGGRSCRHARGRHAPGPRRLARNVHRSSSRSESSEDRRVQSG